MDTLVHKGDQFREVQRALIQSAISKFHRADENDIHATLGELDDLSSMASETESLASYHSIVSQLKQQANP